MKCGFGQPSALADCLLMCPQSMTLQGQWSLDVWITLEHEPLQLCGTLKGCSTSHDGELALQTHWVQEFATRAKKHGVIVLVSWCNYTSRFASTCLGPAQITNPQTRNFASQLTVKHLSSSVTSHITSTQGTRASQVRDHRASRYCLHTPVWWVWKRDG